MLVNVVNNLPSGKVKRELELGGAGKEDSELTLWFYSAVLEGKAGKRKRQKIDGKKRVPQRLVRRCFLPQTRSQGPNVRF